MRYGLEMLGTPQSAVDPSLLIDGQCVAFYIDNNNNGGKCPLVKSDSKHLVVTISVRIFQDACAKRGTAPWRERVPSGFNIADFPKMGTAIPYKIHSAADFSFDPNWPRVVKLGLQQAAYGCFDPDILTGSLGPFDIHGPPIGFGALRKSVELFFGFGQP